jgi:hypothetical protein
MSNKLPYNISFQDHESITEEVDNNSIRYNIEIQNSMTNIMQGKKKERVYNDPLCRGILSSYIGNICVCIC